MRLDVYLSKKGYFKTRTKASMAIERGEVFINGKNILKTSFSVDENSVVDVHIKANISFVSLGGYKLEKALEDFNYNVKNLIVLDLGASTGGFTDCVIKRGAKKVYAVDLNDSLLDESLKQNEKVVQIIKNVKDIDKSDFQEEIDIIVADLSFISSKIYLPILYNLIPDGKDVILLIKPQFEVGEKKKFKNGIIKDKKLLENICKEVYDFALENKLFPQNLTIVPYLENKNTEYLILLTKNAKCHVKFEDLFNKL